MFSNLELSETKVSFHQLANKIDFHLDQSQFLIGQKLRLKLQLWRPLVAVRELRSFDHIITRVWILVSHLITDTNVSSNTSVNERAFFFRRRRVNNRKMETSSENKSFIRRKRFLRRETVRGNQRAAQVLAVVAIRPVMGCKLIFLLYIKFRWAHSYVFHDYVKLQWGLEEDPSTDRCSLNSEVGRFSEGCSSYFPSSH